MKKAFLIFILIINTVMCFAMTQVATTYQTNLTPMDMVEIFIEEINKQNYAWQIGDYKVYTNADEQNYAWAVKVDTSGYTSGYRQVAERSVYLFMKNGWVALKTFGGSTRAGMKETIDANNDYKLVGESLRTAIWDYMYVSNKWLSRYKKEFRDDELLALDKLSTISGFDDIDRYGERKLIEAGIISGEPGFSGYSVGKYAYKKYYFGAPEAAAYADRAIKEGLSDWKISYQSDYASLLSAMSRHKSLWAFKCTVNFSDDLSYVIYKKENEILYSTEVTYKANDGYYSSQGDKISEMTSSEELDFMYSAYGVDNKND